MIEFIRLYDATGNLVGLINEFSDLTITESINSVYECEFTTQLDSDIAKEIVIEGFIECDGKKFTIKEITPHLSEKTVGVYCIGECDGLMFTRVSKFEVKKVTAMEAIRTLLDEREVSTGWSVVYGSSNADERPTAKRTLKLSKTDAGTVWAVLQKIIEKWHVEIDFNCNTHTMRLYKSKRLGQQSVLTVFYEDLNLLDFERTVDSNEVVNNIIPVGKDNLNIKGAEREDGSIVSGTSMDETRDLFKDAPTIPKVMRAYYIDTQEDDKQELYNAALDYLESHCNPSKSYTIKVSDLATVNPNYEEFYRVRIGDTIGVASKTLDARYNLRVVKITRKPNEADSLELELSNRRASVITSTASERKIVNAMIDSYNMPMVGDTILVGDRAIATDNIQIEAITADLLEGGSTIVAKEGQSTVEALMESTVEKVQTNLSNSDGVYRLIYNSNGLPIGMEIVSTSDSNKLWRWDYGGLRYSKDGGATFSNIAIDFEGNVVAKNIASGSVISNSVTMSNLTVTGGSIKMTSGQWDGGILLSDSNGNFTQLAYDGIVSKSTSGTVTVNGAGVSCGSLTADDISCTYGTISAQGGSIVGGSVSGTTGTFSSDLKGNKVFATNAGTSTSSTANARIVNTGQICYITEGSLRKFKHDIEPIDNVIDAHQLYNAEVVSFKYNKGYILEDDERYGRNLAGFIVDDLLETAPDLVCYDEEGNPENWSPRYAIPMMVKLIQEQNKRLCEVEEKLRKLEENK